MVLKGHIWKFGPDVDTDVIIPARYMSITNPLELGEHCMEAIDPDFPKKVKQGDIIVAGKNFGCGSSREHAPLAIKATGISCVIAKSFARIFYRNAFNIGLPLLQCSEITDQIEEGHEIEVDIDTGQILDLSNGKSFEAKPIPTFMQNLIKDGGLMSHLKKRLSK
ncbi:MAG: 3-isopropylmalate dehydratase small subunit [Thermodesulfobacteriota bacterium]